MFAGNALYTPIFVLDKNVTSCEHPKMLLLLQKYITNYFNNATLTLTIHVQNRNIIGSLYTYWLQHFVWIYE